MKKYAMMLLLTMLAVACTSDGAADISGTYTRHTSDEFGELWQTLEVKKNAGDSEHTFAVREISRVKQRKLDDTVWLPEKVKEDSYLATYDPKEKTLEVPEKGLVYSVDLAKKTIGNGKVTFTRK